MVGKSLVIHHAPQGNRDCPMIPRAMELHDTPTAQNTQ